MKQCFDEQVHDLFVSRATLVCAQGLVGGMIHICTDDFRGQMCVNIYVSHCDE